MKPYGDADHDSLVSVELGNRDSSELRNSAETSDREQNENRGLTARASRGALSDQPASRSALALAVERGFVSRGEIAAMPRPPRAKPSSPKRCPSTALMPRMPKRQPPEEVTRVYTDEVSQCLLLAALGGEQTPDSEVDAAEDEATLLYRRPAEPASNEASRPELAQVRPASTPGPLELPRLPLAAFTRRGRMEEPGEEPTKVYSEDDSRCLLLAALGGGKPEPCELADEPPEDDSPADAWLWSESALCPNRPTHPEGTGVLFGTAGQACFQQPAESPESQELARLQRPSTEPWVLSDVSAPERSKTRYLFVGALAVTAAVSWILWGFAEKRPFAPEASAAPLTEPAVAAATAESADSRLTLSIRVEPAAAELTLDGLPVANPLDMQHRFDRREHVLVAKAPGHQTLTQRVPMDRDVHMVLGLSPVPTTIASAGPGRGAAPDRL